MDKQYIVLKSWVILDYKTNSIENEEEFEKLKKLYLPQIDIYSLAWKKITREKVKSVILCFVRA
jgi:ATP-dependent exoDNAse (exonuclease V) beta subunit